MSSSLPSPNLDDRSWAELVEEARQYVRAATPEWTDHSPGDPGIVLVELFAFLTENLLYRLNQVPDKAYVEFLRLMGVRLDPPAAASVTLAFRTARPAGQAVTIPRGTQVTGDARGGQEPPVFVTAEPVTIAEGESEAEVTAHHCDLVEGEIVRKGTGLPGLSLQVARPPIVLPTGDDLDLLVGVETAPEEMEERAPARQLDGRTFRLWREVDSFTGLGDDRHAFVVDRTSGTITFAPAVRMGDQSAPAALAEVPPAGRDIAVWYRRGGGPEGNVAAGFLTILKDPVAGVEVTNPAAATGGRAGESLQNALARGPQELHSPLRAVTASDIELIATRSSGAVARAAALTRAELWAHAEPGSVEVLLVPHLADPDAGVSAEGLRAQETEEARDRVAVAVATRSPLGIDCIVNWANYKTVRIAVRVVVYRAEDVDAVARRVRRRLDHLVSPLPNPVNRQGWPFGQALRASHVFDAVLKEPGVRYADDVKLLVEEVPKADVAALASDHFQERAWYAGSEGLLFRSLNDGDGWEPAGRFPDERVEVVRPHPSVPGLVGVATLTTTGGRSAVHVTRDCGETWERAVDIDHVEDMAWLDRDGAQLLLLATDKGLYEMALGANPTQVLVVRDNPALGFYAVVVTPDVGDTTTVVAAAQQEAGVFLSNRGGIGGSFSPIEMQGHDVRRLVVQDDGVRRFLWAGTAAEGGAGEGCARWELRGSERPPDGWVWFAAGWSGGSAHSLACAGSMVFAGTHDSGVLRLDSDAREPAWQVPDVNCGLPQRDRPRFEPVHAVATGPDGSFVMAGGPRGVYRSDDSGESYKPVSRDSFDQKVTLPATWLFCPGEHDVTVVSEDAAGRD